MDVGGGPRRIEGGYIAILARQLFLGWWLYQTSQITARQLRMFFALFEMRQRRMFLEAGRDPVYRHTELQILLGSNDEEGVRADVRRLASIGLARMSSSSIEFAQCESDLSNVDLAEFEDAFDGIQNRERKVPVPRRVLRYLAGSGKRVLFATVLGHVLRLLYLRKQRVEARGRCKSSWVALVFGVDISSVKRHRRLLLEMGMLEAVGDESSKERFFERRYGKNLLWNLSWSYGDPVVGSEAAVEVAPPDLRPQEAKTPPDLRPVREDRDPLRDLETRSSSGVCKGPVPEERAPSGRGDPPVWQNIQRSDLEDTGRLLLLFEELTTSGRLPDTEATRLGFVGLAVHAHRYGATNPAGLFRSLVEKGRFHFVTQDDEDVAARRLKKALYGGPTGGGRGEPRVTMQGSAHPPDVALVGQLLRAFRARGVEDSREVYDELVKVRPEWTLERWNDALRVLRCA